jgi:hypothetical protein
LCYVNFIIPSQFVGAERAMSHIGNADLLTDSKGVRVEDTAFPNRKDDKVFLATATNQIEQYSIMLQPLMETMQNTELAVNMTVENVKMNNLDKARYQASLAKEGDYGKGDDEVTPIATPSFRSLPEIRPSSNQASSSTASKVCLD